MSNATKPMSATQTGVRLTPGRMTLLAGVLVYGLLGYSITSNMLTPLLPELESSYHISAVGAIWITLVALLSGAAFIPSVCRLGDTLGWKKSMAIGALGCLVVGGVIAAASTSVPCCWSAVPSRASGWLSSR